MDILTGEVPQPKAAAPLYESLSSHLDPNGGGDNEASGYTAAAPAPPIMHSNPATVQTSSYSQDEEGFTVTTRSV